MVPFAMTGDVPLLPVDHCGLRYGVPSSSSARTRNAAMPPPCATTTQIVASAGLVQTAGWVRKLLTFAPSPQPVPPLAPVPDP
jgi:hypothetical protein